MLTRDLIIFYSKAFTRDDITKARKILNKQNNQIRTRDAVQIAFWSGISIVLLIVLVYIIILCDAKRDDWIQ